MGETYLNGRPAVDWEVPVIARARECERARDLAMLAGVLAEQVERPAAPPPSTDLAWEFKKRRPVADISLGLSP